MATWGGAQWVIIAWWAIGLIMLAAIRMAGLNEDPPAKWFGLFMGRVTQIVGLACILAWGGFWS